MPVEASLNERVRMYHLVGWLTVIDLIMDILVKKKQK